MLWTLAVIADSGREMYETLVRPLSDHEREDLWQDYVRFGELFSLPRSEVPGTYREFKAWFDGELNAPDLQATEHGLEMAPLVAFKQPVPAPARGNLAFQNHIIKGTLPPQVREIFGIRWTGGPSRGASGRSPPPAGARGVSSRVRCVAAATTSSSTSSPRPSASGAAPPPPSSALGPPKR